MSLRGSYLNLRYKHGPKGVYIKPETMQKPPGAYSNLGHRTRILVAMKNNKRRFNNKLRKRGGVIGINSEFYTHSTYKSTSSNNSLKTNMYKYTCIETIKLNQKV